MACEKKEQPNKYNLPPPQKLTSEQRNSVMVRVIDLLLVSGLPNMNLNIACGIAGNMDAESRFNYTVIGDNGTSYGLCQWHNKRLTNLINFCNENNLQYSSPEGQVKFLVNELKNKFSYVYQNISSENIRSNTGKVATNFCMMFEVPKDKETVCPKRAQNAIKIMLTYKKLKGI